MDDPITAEDDPIEIILAFAHQIRQARLAKDPTPLNDPAALLPSCYIPQGVDDNSLNAFSF